MPKPTYLKEFGFTPEESTRLSRLSPTEALRELNQNVDFFIQHALEDRPVSQPYFYWSDPFAKLYSHPSLQSVYLFENQIDPKERGGKMLEGFGILSQKLASPPQNHVVIHYSPKGKASFSNDPWEKFEVDSYRDGQLTFQYFDGIKIQAVGVIASNEDLIIEILSRLGLVKPTGLTAEEFITYYLLNPIATNSTVEELLQEIDLMGYSDKVLYRDKNGAQYPLRAILRQVRDSFLGNLTNSSNLYLDQSLAALEREFKTINWTAAKIQEVYLGTILNFARHHGLDEVKLMASCGGSVKSTGDIIDLLYGSRLLDMFSDAILNPTNLLGLHSSGIRTLNSLKKDEESDEYGPLKFECPDCKIINERPPHKLLPKCQHCGSTKVCTPSK